MIQTNNIQELRSQITSWRQQGKKIAFVPTMGNLHEGHLSLVDEACKRADVVVASIFVNPIQFDKQADLDAYPRTLKDDAESLRSRRCDLLFSPTTEIMYPPNGTSTRVDVTGVGDVLEGASRPGHFSGVATVVSKLFNLTTPDVAVFGEKDFQQLMVIRQMVEDLNFDIEIVGHPTVRDDDGLAMSSRNGYLTSEERNTAPALYKTLLVLKSQLMAGKMNYQALIDEANEQLSQHGFKPDYIEIRRQRDLQPPEKDDKKIVILASAWLGKARLIDNVAFVIA